MHFKVKLLIFLSLSVYGVDKPKSPENPSSGLSTTRIPVFAKEATDWKVLIDEMVRLSMHYGVMASSNRMLLYFDDLPNKEFAYEKIVELTDLSYPHSTLNSFVAGDINPERKNYQFSNSYFLYKGILNQRNNMLQWAKDYFGKVDKEKFGKYLFYQAIQSYEKKDFKEAIIFLKKILEKSKENSDLPIIKKASRILARIYFEQEKYKSSLEIYREFLLKSNPIQPYDWLEAAWNLFYLNQFEESVGYLYNLESKAAIRNINPEKILLRALNYRSLCNTVAMDQLIKNFEEKFGVVVKGIKTGQNLKNYEVLKTIYTQKNMEYDSLLLTISNLEREQKLIVKMDPKIQVIANFLFESEIMHLKQKENIFFDHALEDASETLVLLSEKLTFLKFEVAREAFNPDIVFQEPTTSKLAIESLGSRNFVIHWNQSGDFWRDERLKYRTTAKNLCSL